MNNAAVGLLRGLALFSLVGMAAPHHAAAQQLLVGGGLTYADLNPLGAGIQVGAYTPLPAAPGVELGGDLTYYFPARETSGSGYGFGAEERLGMVALNGNGRFLFALSESASGYALGGVNISRVAFKASYAGQSHSRSHTETGLNVGGGLELWTTGGALYIEGKMVTGDLDRMVLSGGFRLQLR